MGMHQSLERGNKLEFIARVPCILLLLILLSGFRGEVASEELVQYIFTAETRTQELEDILFLTIGVELAKAGFSSTRLPDGAKYLLGIAYTSREAGADIGFSISESGEQGVSLAETSFFLTIDYSIDSQISGEVARLLEAAGLNQERDGEKKPASAIKGLFSSALANEMSPEEIKAAKALRFEPSLTAGGVVFIGEATDYFRYGAIASLQLVLRKPWKSWSLSAGARVSGLRAFNDSGVTGGPLYISTAGANLQIGTGYSRLYHFSAAASGGVAVISVTGDETLHKAVPYADAGISIQVPVRKTFFIGFDMRCLLVFDEDMLIMGMAPALSLCKEF